MDSQTTFFEPSEQEEDTGTVYVQLPDAVAGSTSPCILEQTLTHENINHADSFSEKSFFSDD